MAPLTIVFALHVERGHVCAGLPSAGRLRERGHRVVFLGLRESETLVREAGFEFIPYMEDLIPGDPARTGLEPEPLFREFLNRCENGHLDERLSRARPDVVVCDSLLWYVAFRALRLGMPVVSLSLPTTACPGANVPPSILARIPGSSDWERQRVRLDWSLLRLRYFFTKRMASKWFGRYRAPTRMHHLAGIFESMAKRAGVGLAEGRTYRFTEFGPQLILPEVALLPRALEFPHAAHRNGCRMGAIGNPARVEDTRLLDRLSPGKPLVYCSLGSAPHMYPHSRRFFEALMEASRIRREWQWVVAVGMELRSVFPPRCEGNLIVTDWAPQIALLKRARAMVTHGGPGSVVECIYLGVPMVIVPGGRDQPGTMARAVFHGIALGAEMKKVTAQELAFKLEAAMGDEAMRGRLASMRAKIEADDGLGKAAELVEYEGWKHDGRAAR